MTTSTLFILLSLSVLAFSRCCHADLIADVCVQSRAISPASCALILRSDPHSRGADLKTLGQIIIKKTKVVAKITATVARSVRDLNNTRAVNECVDFCGKAVQSLNTISQMLKSLEDESSKSDLVMALLMTADMIDICDTAFAEGPGNEPAELAAATRIAQGLTIVLGQIIIAKML